MSVPQPSASADDLDKAAGEAIAACGGDLRAAIRSLVADNLDLQRDLDLLALAVPHGFSRGFFAGKRDRR